jgi:hypothetical protein
MVRMRQPVLRSSAYRGECGNDIQSVRHRIRPEALAADIVSRPPT